MTETTVQAGRLVPTVAVAYYGEQPIAIIEGPPLCLEDAGQTIRVFDRALTPLRPDRVAVGWQAIYTVEGEESEQFASEDGLIQGVQLTRGIRSEPGTIRWWTTTFFYRRVRGAVTDWSGELETWDVAHFANPYPRKLMCMLADDVVSDGRGSRHRSPNRTALGRSERFRIMRPTENGPVRLGDGVSELARVESACRRSRSRGPSEHELA